MKKNEKTKRNNKIKLESVEPLSPHNEALYEAGKDVLKSSISTARDFCKFMITMSTGAIPTYLALLEFVLPEEIVLPVDRLVLSVIPPFIFLISAVIFTLGYLPATHHFSLDIVEEIRTMYQGMIVRRKKFIKYGIVVFLVGSISAIVSIIMQIIGV